MVGVAPPMPGSAKMPDLQRPPSAPPPAPPAGPPPGMPDFGGGPNVNPLGGTMVASEASFQPPPGFGGATQPSAGFGPSPDAPPPGGPMGGFPPPGGPMGGPPPGGFGPPPGGPGGSTPPPGFGPPPGGAYGAPPGAPGAPGFDPAQPGFGPQQAGPMMMMGPGPMQGPPGMQPMGGYGGGPMMPGAPGGPMAPGGVSDKTWMVTLLLCVFAGGFGAHRFYVGKIGSGIAQVVTLGGCGIWALIDLIMIITGKFTDAQGRALRKD